MDRNQAIGLILISILVIVYFQFFAPDPRVNQTPELVNTVEEKAAESFQPTQETITTVDPVQDSLSKALRTQQLGALSSGIQGEAKDVILENKDLKVTLSTKGGNIKEALLKEYFTYKKDPLIIIDEQSHSLQKFINYNNTQIELGELYYTTAQKTENDTSIVVFSLKEGNKTLVEHIYSLPSVGFQLGYELKLQGLSQADYVNFVWDAKLKQFEDGMDQSRQNTTINYYDTDDDFGDLSARSSDTESELVDKPVKWFAFKQRFFTSAILSKKDIQNLSIETTVPEDEDTSYVKTANAKFDVPIDGNQLTFYFGPNNYQIMKKVAPGFKENVYLGWPVINWFNKWLIIPIFHFLEKYISNYGIIIIILSFIIKILLSPLSYKSYKSMAKTKVLKPELDAIKEKYPDDAQKAQAEQMKLYQQVGVNPLSGCIPLLLQMPILLAMFNFFPNSIELRQESFLWAHDLSTYDSILDLPFTIPFYGDHVSLFTILMTISTVLMTKMNSQMTTVQGPMKTMQYMMPVMFMVFLNNFASGLTFYYFIANLITYGQQVIIRRFIDDDKIRQMLDENKKKRAGKKKSKFQQRLEDAMKTREDQTKKK